MILVREGAVIPHIKLAQSTMQMDWSNIQPVSYAAKGQKGSGLICLPSDNVLHAINTSGNNIVNDPYAGKVKWQIRSYQSK